MWTAVDSRLHSPLKVFPFGSDAQEVMLQGVVAFGLKDGRKAEVSFVFSVFWNVSLEG